MARGLRDPSVGGWVLYALIILVPAAQAAPGPGSAAPSPSPPAGARPRLAVLAVGDDAAAVGSLQVALAGRVSGSQSLEPYGPLELVRAIWHKGLPADVPPDLAFEERSQALIDEVSKSYYAGSPEQALEALGRLDKVIAVPSMAVLPVRISSLLWRTTVLLDQKNREAATEVARAALALDPGLEVPLKVYPPNVQDFIEELRRDPPRPLEVTIEISPRSARVKVDGRYENSRFSVAPGRHYLRVEAPGYRTVESIIEVRRDRALSVGLAPRLPSDLEAIALQLLRESTATDAQTFAYLADRLHTDALAVGTVASGGGEVRARIWSRRSQELAGEVIIRPATGPGQAQLAETVALALEGGYTGSATAAQSGPMVAWEAGVTTGVRPWRIAGGGDTLSTVFAGSGPALRLEVEGKQWAGSASVDWTSYLGPTAVTGAGQSGGFLSGGSSLDAAISGGRRVGLGRGLSPTVASGDLYLRLSYEHRLSQDLTGPSGPLAIFVSYDYAAVELGAGVRLPELHLGSGPAAVSFSAGLAPWSYYSDSPSGSYGSSPRSDPAPALGARLHWTPRGRWSVNAEYRGEWRTVHFSGSGKTPYTSSLQDAVLTEMVNGVTLSVERGNR